MQTPYSYLEGILDLRNEVNLQAYKSRGPVVVALT